ncbi:hypothetical protein [Labrenzia sp. PHM005]|uniref:hypothetical protein n=1 Tax=Labrenzia sp. PHM005 TaxID=2590016 RepID=UPI0011402E03|nr:hypothetical protein [Labrenzia sp. PHM005]QDG78080.1 hypothetical protein FJ695_20665 [Labrenzia sp. PHM005]
MMHTGDHYEARARAERHYELRRLTKALSGFLFGSTAEPHSNRRHRQAANDHSANTSRAA